MEDSEDLRRLEAIQPMAAVPAIPIARAGPATPRNRQRTTAPPTETAAAPPAATRKSLLRLAAMETSARALPGKMFAIAGASATSTGVASRKAGPKRLLTSMGDAPAIHNAARPESAIAPRTKSSARRAKTRGALRDS